MSEALKTLSQSMDKSYELYHYLLILPIALTNLQEQRLDNARNKYLPDEADLNPNTKFIDNLFVAKLRDNEMLNEYLKALPRSWDCALHWIRFSILRYIATIWPMKTGRWLRIANFGER